MPQARRPGITRSFDSALELAEEFVLAARPGPSGATDPGRAGPLKFLESAQDQQDFTAFLDTVHLGAGDTLFEEAQASDETYFVESGRLEVVKLRVNRMPVRLAKVFAGSMIGEMALYSGRPRSASVIAVEAAVLRVLTRESWLRMKQQRPDLATRFDHHVILSLAHAVGRASTALSQQED